MIILLMRKSWFVYIVTNYTNSVLYTGITNNLSRRLWEHRNGINLSSFTKKYKLFKLVWFKEFSSPLDAIKMEKKVKGWTRQKKINLIKENNPGFKNLDL